MNTYRVRSKCAESVNISRRKIKKYVEKLRSLNTQDACPTFRTFHTCGNGCFCIPSVTLEK